MNLTLIKRGAFTMNVSRNIAVAIVNDETDHLDDQDKRCLEYLYERIGPHYTIILKSDETEFHQCDITGLYDNCVQMNVEEIS
jgi:hypothetical protein